MVMLTVIARSGKKAREDEKRERGRERSSRLIAAAYLARRGLPAFTVYTMPPYPLGASSASPFF